MAEKRPAAKKKGLTADSSRKDKKDFLVVGLGASAGGVEALQDFFAAMPFSSGMAFIVVLHLAPNHESDLAGILQAKTSMPVTPVTETHQVKPNHIYVIPPDQNLEMVDGIIRPAVRKRENGNNAAIDIFFRSLAEAYERNAVCIVLSGAGSDGTSGLKRIKESNGFAIVQTPEDAEFDQMPRSAIATQLADWVLPVAQMPEKLLSFKASSERLHLTDGDSEKVAKEINAEESLREILTILRVRTGHDFSTYKTPTLVRRIARHLQIHELEDIPTYLAFLRDNPDEIQSLQRNLLINVTNFFRDKEAFQSLQNEVIPNLFAGKTGRDTVRIWSAGCASGEEAYSLAILLTEYAQTLSDPPKLQVFATDVDDEAVAEAREHSYPDTIEADVSEERLKHFFNKEGKRYRIKKELRETVLFAPHNILRDPPFSKLDLISCRNLLIYLNRETQERVMEIFHFALTATGYLFLGSSETAENAPNLFSITDKKNRLYARRAAHHTQQFAPPKMPIIGSWQIKTPDRKEIREHSKSFSLGEVHYKLLEKYAPPSVLVNQDFEVLYMSENVGRYLRFAGGEPTNNILKLVHPDLLPDLRAALFTAQHEKQSSEFRNLRVNLDGEEITINLIVRAVDVEGDARDLLLIIFDESGQTKRLSALTNEETGSSAPTVRITNKDEAMETVVSRLEADLARTRTQLRATIEQHEVSVEELKASNEELQAINEELRSAGEELETSKEELQSVNEELITVNHELKEKIDETSRTNSDLQNLMASTDIATIFLDKNLLIKRYTPPVEELFSITKADVGRPLTHFTHQLNYEKMAEDAAHVLRKLSLIEKEITDRNNHTYLTRFAPYRTTDDRIEGVVLNFVDITARIKSEKLLRESEAQMQAIVNLVPDLLWSSEPDGYTNWYNQQWLEYTGQTLDEASERGWANVIHPDDRENLIQRYRGAIEQSIALRQECRIRRHDGEYRWFLIQSKPVRDDADKVIRLYSAATDIHESRVASEALRESEEKFRAFIGATSEIVYEMSADWREMHFLKGKEFITTTENPRKDWTEEYIPEDDQPRFWAAINRAIETKSNFELEHRIIRIDRTIGWTVSRAIPILDERGEITKWFGAASDITKRKHTEADLHASKEKYRSLFDSIDEGFCIIEVLFDKSGDACDYRFLETNPAFIEQTGLDQAIGKTMLELAPQIEKFWIETYGEIALSGVPRRFEHKAIALNRWYEVYAFRLGAAEEHKVAVVFKDIAARLLADERLRAAEERLRLASDAVPSVLYDWNVKEDKMTRSGELENLLGFSAADQQTLTNKWWKSRLHPDDAETAARRVVEKLNSRDYRFEDEYRLQHRDGHYVWVRDTGVLLRDDEGKVVRWVGSVADITRRKAMEESLRESEERMRLAARVYGFGVHDYDLVNNNFYWSPELKAIFGLPADTEINLEVVAENLHPEDRARVLTSFKKALNPKDSGDFEEEFRIIRADTGETRWLYKRSNTTFEEKAGKRIAIRNTGVVTDITERKLPEESLRESEERLRIVLEAAELAAWEWNLETDEIIWNERHFLLFGMKPDGKLKTPEDFFRHVHPNDRKRVSDELQKAIRRKSIFDLEFCAVLEDGSMRWMSGYGKVTAEKRGKPIRMSGVMFDINERKQAEESLRKSEEHLQMILESTKDYAIISYDLKGRITRWNTGAAKIFGYTEKEAIGKTSHLIFTPEDRAAQIPEKEMDTAIKKGRAEDERWHLRKDGSRFYASGVMQLLKNGETEGFVKIARDHTAQLEAENARREKETLQQLIAGQEEERRRIARDIHDHFGQQLTALRLKLKALKKISEIEALAAGLEEAYETTKKLDAEVDFLAWELRPAALDDLGLRLALADYIKEWSNSMKIQAEFHSLGINRGRFDYDIEINLYRVVQEALNNIYKHAKAKTVSVLLEKRQNTLNLIIEDDGIGFNSEDKKIKNKGLGLTSIAERISLIGGELKIESSLRQGTTIFVRVPLKNKKEKS